jgi:hypothetical protein
MSTMSSFSVSADQNSVSGGFGKSTGISVSPGQKLTFLTDPNDTWRLGQGPRECNADGLGNPLGADFGKYTRGNYSFLYGTLVGSLDDGQTFFSIGTSRTMILSQSGVLTLYCWDSNRGDNSGEITVTIEYS